MTTKNNQKFLEGLIAYKQNGEAVEVSKMWGENPVIVKVLRRLGCPFCRYEAQMLMDIKHELDELGVRLLAITAEKAEIKEFLESGYWGWDILIDQEDKPIYKAAGLKRVSKLKTFSRIFSKRFISAFKAYRKLNINGNTKGDKNQLGGTFVVAPNGSNLLYEFRQERATAYPSLKEIVSAVGGNPEHIEEGPKDCIAYQSCSC